MFGAKVTIGVLLILQIISLVFAQDNYDADQPTLPMPRYSPDGDIEWFPRIVGGIPARIGEFKAMVSVQFNKRHYCGGTLVDTRFVVTAAHCIFNSTDGRKFRPEWFQVMGDDIILIGATGNRQIKQAKSLYAHPSYIYPRNMHDIAVISLRSPFKTTYSFSPALMTWILPPINANCSVAGWGANYEGGPSTPILFKIDVPIVDTYICNYNYYTLTGNSISPGMFCAGFLSGGLDSCQGDSGGGLYHNNKLVGVVSWGFGCARPNLPGVYTDVSMYAQWIDEVIRNNGNLVSFSIVYIVFAYILTRIL